MPPPNATGILHIGHASTLTYEDIIIRYKRLQGFKTLWLPGTDHAAIATQTKVEKIIASEGLDRHKLGRKKLRFFLLAAFIAVTVFMKMTPLQSLQNNIAISQVAVFEL